MEKLQGWKDPDSPTMRIAARGKIKHPTKLYSLRKVYEESEVDSRFDIRLPKLDGTNLSLSYSSKKLQSMLTRGDGEYGENVIHHSKSVKGIPLSIKDDVNYIFVGEVVTDNKVENFRNYVSGALNQKSAKDSLDKKLRFIVHDVLLYLPSEYPLPSSLIIGIQCLIIQSKCSNEVGSPFAISV